MVSGLAGATQSVKLGGAPYGWRYTKEPDAHGRRNLIEHAGEQAIKRRICEMHNAGLTVLDIARKLIADGVPPLNAAWEGPTIYRILAREGLMTLPRRPKPQEGSEPKRGKRQLTRDKPIAVARAHALRTDGLSLGQIADAPRKERILPARSDAWHAAKARQPARCADMTAPGTRRHPASPPPDRRQNPSAAPPAPRTASPCPVAAAAHAPAPNRHARSRDTPHATGLWPCGRCSTSPRWRSSKRGFMSATVRR